MEKFSIVAILKNEAPYILEWLAFHKALGIDNFVLYENESTDQSSDILKLCSGIANVIVIPWQTRENISSQMSS